MNKKITGIWIGLIILFSVISLSGCGINDIFAWYEGSSENDRIPVVLNAGEALAIERTHFDEIDFEFERFELNIHSQRMQNAEGSAVVTIQDNIITAKNSGHVTITATLIRNRNGNTVNQLGIFVGSFYVVNEATMTHITTAQELADINNNLTGHFILMADIDLSDYEWIPIGAANNEFKGMFVNPYGYTINKMTITTSKINVMHETRIHVGLFGLIYRYSLVSGVILEDISIDVSDFEGHVIDSPRVGGLVGAMMQHAMIIDFSVSGLITGGGEYTGGVVGVNNDGIIKNGIFTGSIKNHNIIISSHFAIGGIVGFNAFLPAGRIIGNIINVTVNADIDGGELASVGGIVGVTNFSRAIENSSFNGTVLGKRAGTKIGFIDFPGIDSPINFE